MNIKELFQKLQDCLGFKKEEGDEVAEQLQSSSSKLSPEPSNNIKAGSANTFNSVAKDLADTLKTQAEEDKKIASGLAKKAGTLAGGEKLGEKAEEIAEKFMTSKVGSYFF